MVGGAWVRSTAPRVRHLLDVIVAHSLAVVEDLTAEDHEALLLRREPVLSWILALTSVIESAFSTSTG